MAQCRGRKADGRPCGAPGSLVKEDGFCSAHGPGAAARMADRGRKGATAMRRKWKARGLEPGELPPLQTPHDAQHALETIVHAAAEGRLPQRQADATTRAVREWLRAYEAGVVAHRMDSKPAQVGGLDLSKLKDEELDVLDRLLRKASPSARV